MRHHFQLVIERIFLFTQQAGRIFVTTFNAFSDTKLS
jgi:hypothetical protein